MYAAEGVLVVSASDLVGYAGCQHRTVLDHEVALGRRVAPAPEGGEPVELADTAGASSSGAAAGTTTGASEPGGSSGASRPVLADDAAVASARGMEHEWRYKELLEAEGLTVVDLAGEVVADVEVLRAAAAQAARAVGRGEADVLYQATFLDDTDPGLWWRGHADFLTKVPSATAPSGWAYEPEDTKLARRAKPSAVLQLCNYAEQLQRLQGSAPERIHVVLGNRERVSVRLREVAAYYRAAKARFVDFLRDGAPELLYPVPAEACALCRWQAHCEQRRLADDHLSGVAQLRGEQARRLEAAGITTIAALAAMHRPGTTGSVRGVDAPAGTASRSTRARASTTGDGRGATRPRGLRMDSATLAKLARQAALQVQAREHPDALPPYEFQPVEPDRGLCLLPEPSAGDVFFDIEGDPYVGTDGLEYLFGYTLEPTEPGERFGPFTGLWAHDPPGERAMFECFIDFVVARRAEHPGMHVYHYAPYEPSRIKTLMGRYGTREAEVDDLLRGNVFVDLYRVVRQGLALGLASYSIKKLEVYYLPPRDGEITDAASSIVEYERWLEEGDPAILAAIEAYNKVDCESTLALRAWLEERRSELEKTLGEALPRPSERSVDAGGFGEGDEAVADAVAGRGAGASSPTVPEAHPEPAVEELMEALLAGVDDPPAPSAGAQQRARWLLAQLLAWHRREAKPGWWRWFDQVLCCGHEELFDAADAIAGLRYEGEVGSVRKSTLHRYSFDPAQECKLRVGESVDDPAAQAAHRLRGAPVHSVGTLEAFDAKTGTLVLLRGDKNPAPHPSALIASGPLGTDTQQAALARLALTVLAPQGLDGLGPLRVARDLLLRTPPRLSGAPVPSPPAEAGGTSAPVAAVATRPAASSGANPADAAGSIEAAAAGTSTAPSTDASLVLPGEMAADAVVRLGQQLDGGCLAVQGPPGSGKTSTAARLIVALLDGGKRVGVTANSHAVVGHLLEAVLAEAKREGVTVNAVHRAGVDKGLHRPDVTLAKATDVEALLASGRCNLVGGTAFLFARPAMEAALDHLVVDEAGQMSLANALAVAGAARNLVLVGDPQQLPQPVQGTHPPGAGTSALEHFLAGEDTMPAHLGVFLDRTWRLHPALCAFVSELSYEERLQPVRGEGLERQAVAEGPLMAGSGVRWVPVDHAGDRQSSPEEAAAVAGLVEALLGRGYTDRTGHTRPLRKEDVLVVAPYNAQVHEIAAAVPAEVRVGTVDRFQGQEAPVVIVSLTASSAADIPRGMEFLYSHNRLNVAVSRAQALAVMVGSPALLAAPCHTVEQMKLVNGLCRFVEYATAQAEGEPAPGSDR